MGIALSPQIHPQVADFIEKAAQNVDQRQLGKLHFRQDFSHLQSRHG